MKMYENDVLLFTGDSITEGNRARIMDCNDVLGHGYQTIISSRLALENAAVRPKFINKGHSGFSMAQLDEIWQENVLDHHPTRISLLAGVNDGYFGFQEGLTPAQIADRYAQALQSALRKTFDALGAIPFVLLEPFYFPLDKTDLTYRYTPHPECEPPFGRPDAQESLACTAHRSESMPLIREAAKRLADENGCIFVPLHEPFLKAMQHTRREYFIWDGTHPTIAGHALIAREWLNSIQ